MGAACCSDKYLVPQGPRIPKLSVPGPDYGDSTSVIVEEGDIVEMEYPRHRELRPNLPEAWVEEQQDTQRSVSVSSTSLDRRQLVHLRSFPSQEDGLRPTTVSSMQSSIDPFILGATALAETRRPLQKSGSQAEVDELMMALAGDANTHRVSHLLRVNAIHNWISLIPRILPPIVAPETTWDDSDDEDEESVAGEIWSVSGSTCSSESPLTVEILAEHNARVLQEEKAKLSALFHQSRATFLAEKSGRVQTLLEAMAAAIDPSLSSLRNTRRDDLVFSSLTSLDELPSQTDTRGAEGRRNTRLLRTSSYSSKSDMELKTGQSNRSAMVSSPAKPESQQGATRPRLKRHPIGSFDRERDDSEFPSFLVCDDNDINCQIVALILRKLCPCKCAITHDGSQAVEAFASHPLLYYRAIVMDIHMPECDGLTATRMIREREALCASSLGSYQKIPIIGLTADSDTKVQAKCMEAGFNCVLLKPAKREELLEALTRCGALADPHSLSVKTLL
eukprot:GGOE01026517.1.p1 GENE.GGOE01026517.1~~GGOE01026517.1.p1  ORF type:complete len:506 (-),score=144.97 GGOE01026517.1:1467-2984(-)